MSLSSSKRAGFALAALIAGDRALSEVRAALGSDDADAVAGLLDARTGARSARVTELLARVRPQLATLPVALPPRMAGLLAARLPRAIGREVLADAPAPRPDFTTSAGLTPRLLRIARRLASGAHPC